MCLSLLYQVQLTRHTDKRATMDATPQWLFSLEALRNTPTEYPIEKEMYDRARGVEFIFRLGSTLQLLVPFTRPTLASRPDGSQGLQQQCSRLQHGFTDSTCATLWATSTVRYSASLLTFLAITLIRSLRQDVAAACVFLSTKTEECGRKLRDVAKVYHSKSAGIDLKSIPSDSKVIVLQGIDVNTQLTTSHRTLRG